jgi:hypothetical protein
VFITCYQFFSRKTQTISLNHIIWEGEFIGYYINKEDAPMNETHNYSLLTKKWVCCWCGLQPHS